MFVFGGRDRVGNFQDLYSFNFDSRVWRRVETSGVDARFFSSLSVFEQWMYIFGGRNIHSFAFNDLLRVNVADSCSVSERRASLLSVLGAPELADTVFVAPDDEMELGSPEFEAAAASLARNRVLSAVFPSEFVGARRVFAHRDVVCCRCAALGAMLASDMREGRSGVVALRGVSARQIRALLAYLYADDVVLEHQDDLMALLALSNQWQLPHLKRLCQERMEKFVSLQNVTRTLAAAQQLDAPLLFAVCRSFVAKNAKLLDLNELSAELQASIASVSSPPRLRRPVE